MHCATSINHRLLQTRLPFVGVFALLIGNLCVAQNSGRVVDAKSKEPMPFVNVSYHTNGRLNGTTTDAEGNYVLGPLSHIDDTVVFQCTGYHTVKKHKQELKGARKTVAMREKTTTLSEFRVVASRQRYSRKNNPAVELMRNAIRLKERNSIQNADSYRYRKHDKVEVSLSNLHDSMRYHRPFRKIGFMFDNLQESELNGKGYVPMYFMETLSETRFDKSQSTPRTTILANRDVEISKFLDQYSLEQVMDEVFGDIDIYSSRIPLLSNEFISPLSEYGILFYHYHITDTVFFDGDTCITVLFSPANPQDYGFYGKMAITKDTNFSVRRVQLNLPHNNSVNFVEQIRFDQDYQRIGGRLLVSSKNIVVDFSVPGVSMHGRKRTLYADYQFDSIVITKQRPTATNTDFAPDFNSRPDDYWTEHRIEPLSPNEEAIYRDARRMDSVTPYRILVKTVMAIAGGYVEAGAVDLGPVENTLSWNSVEGVRLRIGGKTNMRFDKHFFLSGFVAYATKANAIRYSAKAMYSFTDKKYHQYEFPQNLLSVAYEENTAIPGQELMMGTHDRLFQSFGRSGMERMTFDKKITLQYDYENRRHFSVMAKLEHLEQWPLATLSFLSYDGLTNYQPLQSDIFEVRLRYAPRERFYQNYQYRMPINNTSPIYTLTYTYGTRLLGSDFEFHKLKAEWQKRWFVLSIGFLDVDVQAGKIFGQVPYPLLFVHHANQNYTYQDRAFNMMNYFEFASDQYIQLMANYNFNGFIFNRIPLIKKLKLREVVGAKAVWGGVSKRNLPSADNPHLIPFPTDTEDSHGTFTLQDLPYVEMSAGMDNIFKILRLEYVWRLTYLDNPNAPRHGLRFGIHIAF